MRVVSSDSAEVAVLPENDNNALAVQLRQAREQLREEFRAQAEQLQKLEQDLKKLRDGHEQLESEVRRLATQRSRAINTQRCKAIRETSGF